MMMNKNKLLFLLTSILSVFANAQPVATNNPNEQAVFGTQQTQNKPVNNRPVTLKAKELSRLVKSTMDGNVTAAEMIKEAANRGDTNAALQYGYLAHTGKLPNTGTDYAIAMKAYRKATRQKNNQGQEIGFLGNHLAAYNIGLMYLNGEGVAKNSNEAYRWFKISNDSYQERYTNRVFFPAAIQMAKMLETGTGVTRDDKEAVKLWLSATKENSPDAMLGYAKMVLAGRGTIKNPSVAINYLTRAANKWNIEAMAILANLYAKNTAVDNKTNLVEAGKWYVILSTVDKKYSSKARSVLAKLPETDRKSVQRLANSWLSLHANMPEAFDFNKPLNAEPIKIY